MQRYFIDCTAMMLDPENISEIVRDSETLKKPLHEASMEFQRDVLEYNFQIERNFGCKYLSQIPSKMPDDVEMLELAKRFMFTAMRCYLEVLRRRVAMKGGRGKLRTSGGFSRDQIMEFLEACNAQMAMPETKAELKQLFLQTREAPGAKIIEIQRSIIEMVGLEASYGVSCLNRITTDFPDDRELMTKMQNFAMCAQVSCK